VTTPVQDQGLLELTILMPCLNEAETLASCIDEALAFLSSSSIRGEVLIADNSSSDESRAIAIDAGARVVVIDEPGYGSALRGGIAAARGRYVAMADADGSYDFSSLGPFIDQLRDGADLVIGNRFAGGIEPGAMPPLHRYLGNPVLSYVGRLFFHLKIKDFHCGLRAFDRQAILDLNLQTTGMEFASEMIVLAALAGLEITEIPTTLRPDGRSRPPHLRSWHDGWRHLRFLLLFSPRWLFQIPGLVLVIASLIAGIVLALGPLKIGSVTFSAGSLVVAAGAFIVGVQALQFDFITRSFALTEGYRTQDERTRRQLAAVTFERGALVGLLLVALGIIGLVVTFQSWRRVRFGNLVTTHEMRVLIPSVVAIVGGCQVALTAMFVSLMKIRADLD